MGHWILIFELVFCFVLKVIAYFADDIPLLIIVLDFISVAPLTYTAFQLQVANDSHRKLLNDVCRGARESFVAVCKEEKLLLNDSVNSGDFSIRLFVKQDAYLVCKELGDISKNSINTAGNEMKLLIDRNSPESVVVEAWLDESVKVSEGKELWGRNITAHNMRLFQLLQAKLVVVAPVRNSKHHVVAIALISCQRDIRNPMNNADSATAFNGYCESLGDQLCEYYTTVMNKKLKR